MGKRLIKNLGIGTVVYVVIYMILTVAVCSPRILAEYSNIDVSHINENFEFPLNIFAIGLIVICSVCSGIDLGITKKFKLKKKSNVKLSRLLLVIILLSITLVESSLFNYFLGHEYVYDSDYGTQVFKGLNLPLDAIAGAIVTACTFMFSGASLSETEEGEEE